MRKLSGMVTNPRFKGSDLSFFTNRKRYEERWRKIAENHQAILELIETDMGLDMIGRTFNFRWGQWREELGGLTGIEDALERRRLRQIKRND